MHYTPTHTLPLFITAHGALAEALESLSDALRASVHEVATVALPLALESLLGHDDAVISALRREARAARVDDTESRQNLPVFLAAEGEEGEMLESLAHAWEVNVSDLVNAALGLVVPDFVGPAAGNEFLALLAERLCALRSAAVDFCAAPFRRGQVKETAEAEAQERARIASEKRAQAQRARQEAAMRRKAEAEHKRQMVLMLKQATKAAAATARRLERQKIKTQRAQRRERLRTLRRQQHLALRERRMQAQEARRAALAQKLIAGRALLTETQRAVADAFIDCGLSVEAAASALGRGVGYVHSKLSYAALTVGAR